MEANRRRFKLKRNTFVPLHNLPAELFCQIVRFVLVDPEDANNYQYYSRLLPLRLVTPQWNAIIDSTRSLWAFIPLITNGNRPLITLTTRMSKPLPLTILINCNNSRQANMAIRKTGRHSARWKSLDVVLGEDEDLKRILAYPTVNLKALSIEYVWEAGMTIEEPVFMGAFPKLETVRLTRVALPWKAPFLAGLRRLELIQLSDCAPSIDQLLHVLHSSSGLQELLIEASRIHETPVPIAINLPELRKLHLTELRHSLICHIVNHISTPVANDIYFQPDEDGDAEAVLRLAHRVGQWLPQNSGGSTEAFPLTCTIESFSSGMTFEWGEVVLEFSGSNGGAVTMEERVQVCSEICGPTKPKSTDFWVGGSYYDDDLLEVLLSFERVIPNVTRLHIPEGKRSPGAKGSALQTLGQPREVDGALRWLYPMLNEVAIKLWGSGETHEFAELVNARWVNGVGGVTSPAVLKVLELPKWTPQEILEGLDKLRSRVDFVVKINENTHF